MSNPHNIQNKMFSIFGNKNSLHGFYKHIQAIEIPHNEEYPVEIYLSGSFSCIYFKDLTEAQLKGTKLLNDWKDWLKEQGLNYE